MEQYNCPCNQPSSDHTQHTKIYQKHRLNQYLSSLGKTSTQNNKLNKPIQFESIKQQKGLYNNLDICLPFCFENKNAFEELNSSFVAQNQVIQQHGTVQQNKSQNKHLSKIKQKFKSLEVSTMFNSFEQTSLQCKFEKKITTNFTQNVFNQKESSVSINVLSREKYNENTNALALLKYIKLNNQLKKQIKQLKKNFQKQLSRERIKHNQDLYLMQKKYNESIDQIYVACMNQTIHNKQRVLVEKYLEKIKEDKKRIQKIKNQEIKLIKIQQQLKLKQIIQQYQQKLTALTHQQSLQQIYKPKVIIQNHKQQQKQSSDLIKSEIEKLKASAKQVQCCEDHRKEWEIIHKKQRQNLSLSKEIKRYRKYQQIAQQERVINNCLRQSLSTLKEQIENLSEKNVFMENAKCSLQQQIYRMNLRIKQANYTIYQLQAYIQRQKSNIHQQKQKRVSDDLLIIEKNYKIQNLTLMFTAQTHNFNTKGQKLKNNLLNSHLILNKVPQSIKPNPISTIHFTPMKNVKGQFISNFNKQIYINKNMMLNLRNENRILKNSNH